MRCCSQQSFEMPKMKGPDSFVVFVFEVETVVVVVVGTAAAAVVVVIVEVVLGTLAVVAPGILVEAVVVVVVGDVGDGAGGMADGSAAWGPFSCFGVGICVGWGVSVPSVVGVAGL